MIVCVCHHLNERKIRLAIKQGVQSPRDVHQHHGVKVNCGKCLCEIRNLLEESLEPPLSICK